jgi:hypothetical protein
VAKETYRWKRFFQDIRFDPGYELALSRDNQRTIRLLTKEFPQLTTKLKHVDVHHHWLQQEVQEGRLRINWMPTAGMPAEGLMKALLRQKHEAFVRQIGLIDISESEEQELLMPD